MSKIFLSLKKFENKINYGFFTAKGGVSKGNYLSLNCGRMSNDNKNNIKKNINIAIKSLGIANKKLKLINQIHSNKVFRITKLNYKQKIYGDGLITTDKNIALGIITADCAPILLFDKKNNIVCCLHSGWKGALMNIVEKGLEKIKKITVRTDNLVAIVGPCIAFKNYEVDKNFKEKFINKSKNYKNYFKPQNKYKDLFNLRGIINYQLKSQGINNIYNIKKDTFENSHIFFSHRRSCHNNQFDTGRMINIIAIKD